MSEKRYEFATRVAGLLPNPLREQAKHVQEADDYIKLTYGYPSNQAFPVEKLAKFLKKFTVITHLTLCSMVKPKGFRD